jgi:hypothetical protein
MRQKYANFLFKTFWFFAAVTFIGLLWVYFFLPETAGRSLEGMDELFNLPWHIIGRKGANITEGMGSVAEAVVHGDTEKSGGSGQIEQVEVVDRK